VASIAIAADERLGTTVLVRAQEKPGIRQVVVTAIAALILPPPMAWTRVAVTAKMPLQSCLCTV
jgi:hypothetical protein